MEYSVGVRSNERKTINFVEFLKACFFIILRLF